MNTTTTNTDAAREAGQMKPKMISVGRGYIEQPVTQIDSLSVSSVVEAVLKIIAAIPHREGVKVLRSGDLLDGVVTIVEKGFTGLEIDLRDMTYLAYGACDQVVKHAVLDQGWMTAFRSK